jgi:uncharacterized protein (DUF2132 family)
VNHGAALRFDCAGGRDVALTDDMPSPISHPRDPLHGITLETIVTELSEQFGWAEMAARIPVRCFQFNPSVKSSLTFLRKTPWARAKVEAWFVAEQMRRAEAASQPDADGSDAGSEAHS